MKELFVVNCRKRKGQQRNFLIKCFCKVLALRYLNIEIMIT